MARELAKTDLRQAILDQAAAEEHAERLLHPDVVAQLPVELRARLLRLLQGHDES